MTLAEFLLARIAEDEADARLADGVTDKQEDDWQDVTQPLTLADTLKGESWAKKYGYAYQHICRHDPARVLAECEAKRRILALHRPLRDIQPVEEMTYPEAADTCASCGPGDHWSWQELSEKWLRGWCPTLAALTLPYADHPDYDKAWRA